MSYIEEEILPWELVGHSTKYGRYTSEIERKTVLNAHNLITKPTTALEIGCEGGRWSKLLADFGWEMICTDIDQKSLAVCQRRIPTATCTLVSPEDTTFPCATESIGLTLCIQV